MSKVNVVAGKSESLAEPFFAGLYVPFRLALPLQSHPDTDLTADSGTLVKTVFVTYAIVVCGFAISVGSLAFASGGNIVSNFNNIMLSDDNGLKSWDRNGIYICMIMGLACPVAYYFAFRGMSTKLNRLTELYGQSFQHLPVVDNMERQHVRQTNKNVTMLLVLVILRSLAVGPGNAILAHDVLGGGSSIIIPVFFDVGSVIVMYALVVPPVLNASMGLMLYFIRCVGSRLDRYGDVLSRLKERPNMKQDAAKGAEGKRIGDFIVVGSKMVELTEQLESTFEDLIAVVFLNFLVLSTCGLFLVTGLGSVYKGKNGEWNLVLLSYGIAYAIQNVLSLSTLSSFIALGQGLCDGYKKTKKGLESILMNSTDSLTESERTQLGVLIDQFDNDAPLKPKNIFSLSNDSGSSMAGLVLTYLIVLIQFKGA